MKKDDVIEKLNLDYLNIIGSKEYQAGFKKYNKKIKNIDDLFFKINRKIHLLKINDRGKNFNFSDDDCRKMNNYDSRKNRIVVYSCIVGVYDCLQEPLFKSDNIDYVMFTNCAFSSKIWNIKKIPENIMKLNNNILINRYIKFHPFEFFDEEYDYSIYVDGNILIVSDLSSMICLVNPKYGIAFHNHYARNCLYEEATYCMYNKKGDKKAIKSLISKYKTEGFPKKYGLVEAPVIISNLHSDISMKIQKSIYNKLIDSKTYRDQLCIPYILWKNNIKVAEISTLGQNIHYNYKIISIRHKK